jgi:pimeloyl-ACP methyl ester carboxylesterase
MTARTFSRPLHALLLALAAISAAPSPASAAPSASSAAACLNSPAFSCSNLTVPLDRSGGIPGTVTLSVERLQRGAGPSQDAVVALAGGPGQAAIPLAGVASRMMSPALASRDLVVFDQRGTGTSGPLECAALERPSIRPAAIGGAFERCAKQLGQARGSYTSEESVEDIEAIRQAFGYRKLVLFGVSYGTKVALRYAERHPANVEALVLDSVVPPDRADPFSTSTFEAIAPMLAELCSAKACDAITANPGADMTRLAGRLHASSLRGDVYDGSGHRHRASMSDVDLLNLIGAGDLNPALRALLPAAVQSALHADPSPLLRLNLLSEGLIPNVPLPRASGGIDEALFVDTTCEEETFPWQRSSPPASRIAEAIGALDALPSSDFLPFSRDVEWADSLLPGCARWPNLAPSPSPTAPLPDVPTLLLSGMQDVRTPTSNAQIVAARISGAQLLTVPYTGHSVLGSDFSGCAEAAVKALFASQRVQPCQARTNPFTPTPITPTVLDRVKPVGGVPGKTGRTLAVALDTVVDLERQVVGATLQAEQALPSGASFGGLRGGYARLSSSVLTLHRLSFVTGVELSGAFPIRHGRLMRSTLRVEGPDAARGAITIAGNPRVTGTLGGRRFDVNLAKVRLAGASDLPVRLARLSRWPTPCFARARPTCASTPTTRSTGWPGGLRPSSGRASETSRCSCRSATRPVTGVTSWSGSPSRTSAPPLF